MKHVIMMLIGCVLPFLLIFILPALGVSNDVMLSFSSFSCLAATYSWGTPATERNTMSNATKTISPARFGFAIGATCVIFRLACILTLITCRGTKRLPFLIASFTASMSRQSWVRV